MPLAPDDLIALRRGEPPPGDAVLEAMTLGRRFWLDHIRDYYLNGYIARGGSKVKVLAGPAGTGKTHLLQAVLLDASRLGYQSVYLPAWLLQRLNDLPGLYRAIVSQLDLAALVNGLCGRVVEQLGFSQDRYDGSRYFLHVLYEEQGLTRDLAVREIRLAARAAFRDLDVGPSFRTFAYDVIANRLIHGNEGDLRLALKWLSGEKLTRPEKQATLLFERLQKTNARYWLNSLVCLLRSAGLRGLVVAIDGLDVMAERDPATRRFLYSPNAVKDICELFRQLIDDVELLGYFLLFLAGRPPMLFDEKRGFMSYEALWMRLQTGLVSPAFNPFADVLDSFKHLQANGQDFPEQVHARLRELFDREGLALEYGGLPDLSHHHPLRARVIEAALLVKELDDA